MSDVVEIDGASGEGGGQIVRSSLALAMLTGRAVRIENLRAKRAKPGLARQHLTAVLAAAKISGAQISGAEVGSRLLSFAPGPVQPGNHTFDIGSSGSTTLVVQTILLPLLLAGKPSTLILKGGTHNPLAPPFEFLALAYLPLVNRMGPRACARLVRHGFYPAGGGELGIEIEPAGKLEGLLLLERGPVERVRARALLTPNLPRHIGERELGVVAAELGWAAEDLEIDTVDALGGGNALVLEMRSRDVVEVVSAIGSRGVPAERVAASAAAQARQYIAANVPVGEHLADQILLPLAVAGQGRFRTMRLSSHAQTHIQVIGKFLNVAIDVEPVGDAVEVRIGP